MEELRQQHSRSKPRTTVMATHSFAWNDGIGGMKHTLSIIFTLVNFSLELQKDKQRQFLSTNKQQNPLSCSYIGLRVFTCWTGDVHMHAGYNTLWDAVINRRQKLVDVQGVQVGKSHNIALKTGEGWQQR